MSTIMRYYSSKGLDLTSSDYSRPEDFHSGAENIVLEGSADDPVIESRKGHQVKMAADPVFETIRFVRRNPTTDTEEEELLLVGEDSLLRKKEAYLTVSYAGAGTTCTLSLKYNTTAAQLQFVLTVDGSAALTYNLGAGFDEASPKTIAQLATAINAVSGFTATTSGTTTISAAFLDVTVEHNLKAESLTLYAYETETITYSDYTFTYPFTSSLKSSQDQDDFEAVSYATLNNILYIANGDGGRLMKYDGKRIYKAGLPVAYENMSAPVEGGTGSLANGTRRYRFRFVYTDSVGNTVYGPLSEALS